MNKQIENTAVQFNVHLSKPGGYANNQRITLHRIYILNSHYTPKSESTDRHFGAKETVMDSLVNRGWTIERVEENCG